ncbi:MAG: hypothetical protein AAB879_02780 [Patescibacteria group bacterium]
MIRHALGISLLLFSLTGVGCLKKRVPTIPPPSQPLTNTPAVVSFQPSKTSDTSTNAELDAILKNFRSVKSFRMKLAYATPQGDFTSTLEFLRPHRFRGLMQIANQAATEIIVVDDSLYMRSSGGKWTDLSGTEAAKVVGSSLKNSLSGDSSVEKIGVDPDAVVKKTRDDARRCDLYKARVRSTDGSPADLEICAADGLPHFVTLTTQHGPFTFEYYKYNELFLIEKPV